MPYFSITIPVYNVEKYLRQCLDSVLGQTFGDFEVIILDDGSTDSSGKICDEYADKDGRIKVIHDVNQGQLMARVRAQKHATGKYVLFLDSDDYWEDDLLETVYNETCQNDVDMILIRFRAVDESGKELFKQKQLLEDRKVIENAGKFLCYQLATSFEYNSMALKVFKRTSLDMDSNYEKYSNVYMGEDALQIAKNLSKIETLMYLGKPFYNYRINTSSITTRISGKYIDSYITVREEIDACIEAFYGSGSKEHLCKMQYDLRGFVGGLADAAVSSSINDLAWKLLLDKIEVSKLFQNACKSRKKFNFISWLYLVAISQGSRFFWKLVGRLKRILKYCYDRFGG